MKALNALTPEQQKRFSENLVRWMDMPPEEKQAPRSYEEFRRKRIVAEVETVLNPKTEAPAERLRDRKRKALVFCHLQPALRALRASVREGSVSETSGFGLKNLDLHLKVPHRTQFLKRYAEERRTAEQLLRKETEDKRRALLKDLNQRLKAEFSEPAQGAADSSTAPQKTA